MHKLIKQPVSSYTEFEELQWSSDKPIPPVGTEIDVPMNNIGRSKVLKYFVEHGYIGLLVQPLDPPAWYIKQNGVNEPCHVYPPETKQLRKEKV
ncbi:MAG: hypothetical protein P8P37_01715 [Candidatus Marinimicrobia bacterium]|nr:hypothetical protein [Candidatus Neomarinimicrobiota bacterium]